MKDAFATHCEGHEDIIKNAYTNIYKEFYHWEFYFYNELIQKKSIPEKALFVMKTLGDEIWIIIDLDEVGEIPKASVIGEVISSLNAIFLTRRVEVACPISMDLVGNNLSAGSISSGKYMMKSIFFKIFVDVIEKNSLVDLSAIRAEVFRSEVYDKAFNNNVKNDSSDVEHFADSLNRFCVGSSDVRRKVVNTKLRKDYVGRQVDRFFRCTSFALPNLICIGRSCINVLKSESNNEMFPVGNGVLSTLRLFSSHTDLSIIASFQAFRMSIVPGELKGISGDYSLVYIFNNPKLLKHNLSDLWCHETKKILSKHGLTWSRIVASSSKSLDSKYSV